MEKSGNNFLKLLKSGRGQGNSFSANLRCLNFEMFGKAHPRPPKILGSLVTIQAGSAEKSSKSSVILLKNFCIHPVIYICCSHTSPVCI